MLADLSWEGNQLVVWVATMEMERTGKNKANAQGDKK